MLVRFFGPGVVACVAERTTTRLFMPGLLEAGGYGLPKAYGGVIAVNLVASTFTLISLGMRVGQARKKLAEQAKKDGDEHADERFGLPKMQAEGFSDLAKKFNCIQRGHQQALETYGSFLALSAVGGVVFPITTIVSGALWIYARKKWAAGRNSPSIISVSRPMTDPPFLFKKLSQLTVHSSRLGVAPWNASSVVPWSWSEVKPLMLKALLPPSVVS